MRRAYAASLHALWTRRKVSNRMTGVFSLLLTSIAFLGGPPAVFAASFTSDYLPHGYCYLWDWKLLSVHLVSDLLIGLSYLSISFSVWYLLRRFRRHLPFHWVYIAFGVFIAACGITHFMEVVVLWFPAYWVSGLIKGITAVASVGTAVALPTLTPKVFDLVQTVKASSEL